SAEFGLRLQYESRPTFRNPQSAFPIPHSKMGKGQPKPTKPPPTKAKANKQAGKKPSPPKEPEGKLVSDNRKARFRFEIIDSLECGVQLLGSEVKSLRDGKLSLEEAYARV